MKRIKILNSYILYFIAFFFYMNDIYCHTESDTIDIKIEYNNKIITNFNDVNINAYLRDWRNKTFHDSIELISWKNYYLVSKNFFCNKKHDECVLIIEIKGKKYTIVGIACHMLCSNKWDITIYDYNRRLCKKRKKEYGYNITTGKYGLAGEQ